MSLKKLLLTACMATMAGVCFADEGGAAGAAPAGAGVVPAAAGADEWASVLPLEERWGNEDGAHGVAYATDEQKANYRMLVARILAEGASELSEERVKKTVNSLSHCVDNGIVVDSIAAAFEVLGSDDFVDTLGPLQLAILPMLLMKMPADLISLSTTKEYVAMRSAPWLTLYREIAARADRFMLQAFYIENCFKRGTPATITEEDAMKWAGLGVADEGMVVTVNPTHALLAGHVLGLLWKAKKFHAYMENYFMQLFVEIFERFNTETPGQGSEELCVRLKAQAEKSKLLRDKYVFVLRVLGGDGLHPMIKATAKKFYTLLTFSDAMMNTEARLDSNLNELLKIFRAERYAGGLD